MVTKKKSILADTMGLGKELSSDTNIPTPNGFIELSELKKGDYVFGSDGNEYVTKGVYPQGVKENYIVEFSDGSKAEAGLEHIWIVNEVNGKDKKWVNKTTSELIECYLDKNNKPLYEIPITSGVDYKEVEHKLHPYLLGTFIGCGGTFNYINSSFFECKNEDQIHFVTRMFDKYNTFENNYLDSKETMYGTIKLEVKELDKGLKSSFYTHIDNIGLADYSNKEIPSEYLIDSIENRKLLLGGIMDSNAHLSSNGAIVVLLDGEKLGDTFCELVNSLGGICDRMTFDTTKNDVRVVQNDITVYLPFNPFVEKKDKYQKLYDKSVPKKHKNDKVIAVKKRNAPSEKISGDEVIVGEKAKVDVTDCHRYITKIRPNGEKESICIEVDSPDRSYLCTNNYIVTHNTTTSIIAAEETKAEKVLIVTTASVKTSWKRELEYYVDSDNISVIYGSDWKDDTKYVIVNYDVLKNFYKLPEVPITKTKIITDDEGNKVKTEVPVYKVDKNGKKTPQVRMSTAKKVVEQCLNESPLYTSNFQCVIIDEAHKLSNRKSKRYRIINDFLKKQNPEYVFLLTGTPLTNNPENLYNVLKLIENDVTGDYHYYMKRYCGAKETKINGRNILLTNGATNLDELGRKIKDIYIRRLHSDIPGMVTKTVLKKIYDLNDHQKKEYDKIWGEYLAKINAEEKLKILDDDVGYAEIISPNDIDPSNYRHLVESILIRQFLAKEMVPNTIDIVDQRIEEGEKVVIVCNFKEEMKLFQKYYKHNCVVYNGDMTVKEKDASVHSFQNDPNVKVFVGQIVSAGVGITLTASRYLIFNSYSWAEIDNRQVQDRIYRLSQDRDVICLYQTFNDTISENMYDKVIKKGEIMDTLILSEEEKQKFG